MYSKTGKCLLKVYIFSKEERGMNGYFSEKKNDLRILFGWKMRG